MYHTPEGGKKAKGVVTYNMIAEDMGFLVFIFIF